MTSETNMTRFTEMIITALRDRLSDADITIQEVSKPGEQRLTGLCIRSPQTAVAPVLYLDEPFKLYRQGTPVSVIADKLLEIYNNNLVTDMFDPTIITDWGLASERLTARLVNMSHNRAYLEEKLTLPIPGTDIGFMYSLDLSDFKEGASVTVSRDMLTAWHITPGVVHDIAFVNTARLHPAEVCPLSSIISELTGETGPACSEEPVMYVVTNREKVNGAVSILLPDVAQSLYDLIGDYYILPSSIHEIIAVPKATADPHTLLQMVIDINRAQVAPEDRLADDVFEICNGNLVSVFTPDEHQAMRSLAPAWLAE